MSNSRRTSKRACLLSNAVNKSSPYSMKDGMKTWSKESKAALLQTTNKFIENGKNEQNSSEYENKDYTFKLFKFYDLDVRQKKWSKVPLPRSGHRIVCNNGNFFSFGGYLQIDPRDISMPENLQNVNPRHKLFDELWRFNFANQCWYLCPSNGQMPQELASHSAVMYGNFILVFGGTGTPFGNNSSNKLHVCDLNTYEWKEIETTGDMPIPAYGQAVVLDDEKMHFYVIGGTTGYDYILDVHRLDMRTNVWTLLYHDNGDPQDPRPRYRHEVAYDKKYIYLIGGGTATSAFCLDTVPAFNIEKNTWEVFETRPSGGFDFPKPRKCHGLVQFKNEVYICGGYDSSRMYSDLWKLDLSTKQWTSMPNRLPEDVYFHSMAITEEGCLYIFGGVTNIDQTRRTDRVVKVWLKLPSLQEMAWEASLKAQPMIKVSTYEENSARGVPPAFRPRITPLPNDLHYQSGTNFEKE